jgi:two-component system, oxyanion-binding sensor
MTSSLQPVRIGFIPLTDAAPLCIAVDKGFMADEGLDAALVREASWSNVRDKLNIGLFDAAHMLAPMAVAASLGLGHLREALIAPYALAANGNAITLSPALHAELAAQGADLASPAQSAAALARVAKARAAAGRDQLVFGMTFPFSAHNYLLRYWMAAGGLDPDEDARLVVLPPPYMVESLARGQVDGFCVGAPWNSVAVEAGAGVILHCGNEIFSPAVEKVLAFRENVAFSEPALVAAIVRALARASRFLAEPENFDETAALLSGAERIGVDAEIIARTLKGRMRFAPGGPFHDVADYLLFGDGRPEPAQAAWLFAQMARWGQAPASAERLTAARRVFRPDLYDAALRLAPRAAGPAPRAFDGRLFHEADVAGYLSAFAIRRGG